jgi:Rhs element Vgr protein
MKDSDVFRSLLGTYSLSADVDATTVQHRELVQYACTDWDFMVNRAEVNGMQVLTNGDGVVIKSPNTSAQPKIIVLYGSTVLEFEAEIDARDQLPQVTARSWDAANQSLLTPQGSEPQITLPGNLDALALSQVLGQGNFTVQHGGGRTEPEIRAWADAQSLKSRLSKVRGRVKFTGYGDINPGDIIELKGFGDRFNGRAFVTGVRHEIAGGLWTTDAQFGGTPFWFTQDQEVSTQPASGLIPAVSGLQVGIVTKLQGDPDGEDRIQVTMPLVNRNESGTWARLATLDASNQRGSFFRPEIGDEVIVGFLNEDPRDPIILGMMNSSAKPAPISSSDDNHEKGFVTRSGMKLLFNDDKKSISLETPAGKSVTLDEAAGTISVKDENGNKIDMGSQGIQLESLSNITLKAGGTLTIGGSSVSFKADQSIKVEASAGAELTSTGVMVIKGSLVQIN